MKEFVKKYRGLLITALAAIFLVVNIFKNTNLQNKLQIAKKEKEVAEYNLQAAHDTIRIIQDRAGKQEANKYAYLTNSVDELKKLNKELSDQVKQIKGNVQTIISAETKIVEKPVPFVVKAELLDSTIRVDFNYDSLYSPGNYRKLSGYTKYDLRKGLAEAEKLTDETGIAFITGIKDLDKGKPTIFLKSDYPGFSVTKLDGAELDPKLFQPKKRSPLVTASVGVYWVPATYDWQTKKTYFSTTNIGLGAGISFDLFKLLGFKK